MADTPSLSQEQAEMLATKWWSVERFRSHGVHCRMGAFTLAETDSVKDAICLYQESRNLSEDDILDVIFGETKHTEFWAHIAHSVPPRRLQSVYNHVQQIYHPFWKPGRWTKAQDARLTQLVGDEVPWLSIADRMEHPLLECRRRYHNSLEHQDILRKEKWSTEEETRLITIIQDKIQSGQSPQTTPKFWKDVSIRMGNTRAAKQCSNRWNESLSPEAKKTPRWHPGDSCILVQKIALLNVHDDDEIRWEDLTDEHWKGWTAEKLRQRWVELKAEVHTPNATHHDIVQRLTTKFPSPRASAST